MSRTKKIAIIVLWVIAITASVCIILSRSQSGASSDALIEAYTDGYNRGVEDTKRDFTWLMTDRDFSIGENCCYTEITMGLKFLWYRYEHHGELWDYEIENDFIRTWRVT